MERQDNIILCELPIGYKLSHTLNLDYVNPTNGGISFKYQSSSKAGTRLLSATAGIVKPAPQLQLGGLEFSLFSVCSSHPAGHLVLFLQRYEGLQQSQILLFQIFQLRSKEGHQIPVLPKLKKPHDPRGRDENYGHLIFL